MSDHDSCIYIEATLGIFTSGYVCALILYNTVNVPLQGWYKHALCISVLIKDIGSHRQSTPVSSMIILRQGLGILTYHTKILLYY